MTLSRLLLLASLAVTACGGRSKQQTPPPPAEATGGSGGGVSAHIDDDDEHACAHPPSPPPQVATATALGADARGRLTTLRVMAHEGAVIVRKEEGQWVISGPQGCRVPPERVERALDNLAGLRSERTTERPKDGSQFELQVVAQIEQERALHFDMAGRVAGKDLVQLGDFSTYWITGFDRQLWTPDAKAWCNP